MRLRLFLAVDGLAHRLRPGGWPWLCDRLDLWLGVTPDEMARGGGRLT